MALHLYQLTKHTKHMSTKQPSIIALLLGLLLFSGCAMPSGPKFTQMNNIPNDKALIYLYRKGSLVGSANAFKLRANGELITAMQNGGYYTHISPPGEVALTAQLELNPLNVGLLNLIYNPQYDLMTLKAEAGRTYYLQTRITFSGLKMKQVDEATGAKEIKRCSLNTNLDQEHKTKGSLNDGRKLK